MRFQNESDNPPQAGVAAPSLFDRPGGSELLRTFLEAMSRDAGTAQGGVVAYMQLDAAERDAWISCVERVDKRASAPIGLGVLALFGAETDAGRQRRLLACAAEPAFALRKVDADGAWWRLVRPLGCEYASIATVHLGAAGSVQSARYEPFATGALAAEYVGVALADAVSALAHAVVRAPDALRPALLPFVELFSPTARVLPEVAA